MTIYYEINEKRAQQAKHMNSFYAYRPGSATEEYRAMVDKAAEIAEAQKAHMGAEYHDKIDRLLDTYARKLAANMNKGFDIECRCPSIMVAGPANFPVHKKEKQNAARNNNLREWREIQHILDKIKSTGIGGISADDPNALDKLRGKLTDLEEAQEIMKLANAHYRKHGTMDNCAILTGDVLAKIRVTLAQPWRTKPAPFERWALSNNNANIKRIRERIAGLEKLAAKSAEGWKFDGGEVVINTELNRLQILFDSKPDEGTRSSLKRNGFKWAPSQGAWQRQYTSNAVRAAEQVTQSWI